MTLHYKQFFPPTSGSHLTECADLSWEVSWNITSSWKNFRAHVHPREKSIVSWDLAHGFRHHKTQKLCHITSFSLDLPWFTHSFLSGGWVSWPEISSRAAMHTRKSNSEDWSLKKRNMRHIYCSHACPKSNVPPRVEGRHFLHTFDVDPYILPKNEFPRKPSE